jgi:hypothetical protein
MLRLRAAPAAPLQIMTRTKLPSRTADAWEGGFLMRPPRSVHAVSCASGRVIATGTDEFYLIRAGTDSLLARKLPPGVPGPLLAIAAERRPPWRIAVAPVGGGVVIFEQAREGETVVHIEREPPRGDVCATHLTWDNDHLHARWDDGAFSRINSHGDQYVISLANGLDFIDMLASDGKGSLAMLSLYPLRLYRKKDDDTINVVQIDFDLPDDPTVYLAVAGQSVAVSVKGVGTFRDDGAGFESCDAHLGGGAIAFQGASTRAALFGAMVVDDVACIVRMAPTGESQRICEIEARGLPPAEMVALAWDESRTSLWGASPNAGLVRHTPRASRGKRRALS